MNMKGKPLVATLLYPAWANNNLIASALQITRPPFSQRPSPTIWAVENSVHAAEIFGITGVSTPSTIVIGGKYATHKNDNG